MSCQRWMNEARARRLQIVGKIATMYHIFWGVGFVGYEGCRCFRKAEYCKVLHCVIRYSSFVVRLATRKRGDFTLELAYH